MIHTGWKEKMVQSIGPLFCLYHVVCTLINLVVDVVVLCSKNLLTDK